MKSLKLAFFMSVIFGQVAFGQDNSLPVRYSSDFSLWFLYLSKNIAIEKHTSAADDKIGQTYFGIGKAHFINEPDVVDATGDTTDADIASDIKRLGTDSTCQWLLIPGPYTDEKKPGLSNRPILIFLPTEKIYSADNLDALQSEVNTNHIVLSSFNIQPVEIFFDRQLVPRLKHNNSPSQ